MIADPSGEVVAGPLIRERGMLFADLDLDAVPVRKRLLDVTGHYNRPDIFRLEVDDRSRPAVVRGSNLAESAAVAAPKPAGGSGADPAVSS